MKLGDKALEMIARDMLMRDEVPATEDRRKDIAESRNGASTCEPSPTAIAPSNILPFHKTGET